MQDDWILVSYKDFIDYKALALHAVLFVMDWRLILMLRALTFYKKNKKYIFYFFSLLSWLTGFSG